MYRNVQLFIDGSWRDGADGRTIDVENPATGKTIGIVARAEIVDLEAALHGAARGFAAWRATPAAQRGALMMEAARVLADRREEVAHAITLEQGKPLKDAQAEVAKGVELIQFFAGEAVRAYGRVIPAIAQDVSQQVVREPVGPVAGFTPWNFPINQVVRKIGPALAAGCSIIVKAAEETPLAAAMLVGAFADAGLPAGVLNLVFGDPAEISNHLIAHRVIRKLSFTGSTPVGKLLAAHAGQHMKRVTMELGGHGPAIICADADVERAAHILATNKYRNTGQSCISPTRFVVHEDIYEQFIGAFLEYARTLKTGDPLDPSTQMGPLSNHRRVEAIERLVQDAVARGATLLCGGERGEGEGHFYAPTVLADVPIDAAVMTEEPFGPIAVMMRFTSLDDALEEANRLPYGLAAYCYTRSAATAATVARDIESGMVSINHHGVGVPESPFGGVKDSGYGSEGGPEAVDCYMITKFITQANG